MTPFKIRKRVKRLLRKPKPEIIRHAVVFVLPDGTEQTVQVEEHYTLMMASQALPSPIGSGRRAGSTCPDGGCGACQVEILSGAGLSPVGVAEREALDAYVAGDPYEGSAREAMGELLPGIRLACHAKVLGAGAKVKVLSLVDFDALRGSDL